MKIHPGSVVAQRPHSAIIYDELVCTHSCSKSYIDSGLLSGFHNPNLCTGSLSCVQGRDLQCLWFHIWLLLVIYCSGRTTGAPLNAGVMGVLRVRVVELLRLMYETCQSLSRGSCSCQGDIARLLRGICKIFVFWSIVLRFWYLCCTCHDFHPFSIEVPSSPLSYLTLPYLIFIQTMILLFFFPTITHLQTNWPIWTHWTFWSTTRRSLNLT